MKIFDFDLQAIASVDDFISAKAEANAVLHSPLREIPRRIWIYGAGQLGHEVLSIATSNGVEVVGFLDRNSDLWGSYVDGLPVAPLIDPPRELIVVAIYNMTDTLHMMREWSSGNAVSYAEFCLMIGEGALPYWCLQSPTTEISPDEMLGIREVEARLDLTGRIEFSRQLATRFMIGIEKDPPKTGSPANEYFGGLCSRFGTTERLLDIGAYDGDTAARFLELAGQTEAEVIAVEADPSNFQRLNSVFGSDPRVRTINAFVGEDLGLVRVEITGTVRSREAEGDGGAFVPKLTVDEIVRNEGPVTRVKMDVEGAERRVLAGARDLISNRVASWAISSYHRPEDLWEIPTFFNRYDYFIEVHSHAQRPWDTVLSFIPVESP